VQTFGFHTDLYWHNVGMLCALLAAFLAATFLLLRYQGRPGT
jgi:hypothetical protein